MSSIIIDIRVDADNETARLTAAYRRQMQAALIGVVEDTMDAIEAAQIHKYTINSDPALPAGSDYVRSFTLRDTSQKRITNRELPEIRGEWSTSGAAAYDQYVLGSRNEQAAIHRGRWKSTEEIEEEIAPLADEIAADAMENIT